ncbi:periplasmic divalent cation tolerance protein [Marchantia polymorpha subsp. ruderalis]|uniref:Uncharacterized protein n=2 Tax=Marchantia polymorpha TaxID=3197 RepID=A0A176W7H0_MARPO|nr:hypothetical protein AXG93_3036s1340 [Marchantia polymorpha subsp. ruderalis]PTQ46393.1 hypothetical protein MARPO_0011s0077 [Marchantia polymorpha]BBN08357.1 hypothetical protein Mp_4g10910 [Marchantia polymorpha subsp. ruderalis]|eukprot:PTQ46393.1 hypothetical protein MARPO_0011s0077 [Marchantia polymorpha]
MRFLDVLLFWVFVSSRQYASGGILAVKRNGTFGERLDEFVKIFGTATTGIDFPSESILKRGPTNALSNSYLKSRFTSRAMAEAGEAAVPLIVVYVTVPNKETATSLATSIVSNKLAACVNQVPGVMSTYMWEGKVETEEEILLIIKTRQALLDSLTVHVKSNHPYTVPEVIALPILGGSDSYVQWVVDNTQKADDVIPPL